MKTNPAEGFTIDFHFKFNAYTERQYYEKNFPVYIKELKKTGAERIVIHRPRPFLEQHKERLENMSARIQYEEIKPVLYTGIFGTENIIENKFLLPWVQRNKNGELLSYMNGGARSAMMCPASPYVTDYLAPRVVESARAANAKSIFLDIPWIMKGGCYCSNCKDIRESGGDNKKIVRQGLERFVNTIKKEIPGISLGVNSSAPGIYLHAWHGAEINNFKGLFEEYITEWTPYQWGQKPEVVTKCILNARGKAEGKFYHATICKDNNKNLYPADKLSALFKAILDGGALPWLCVNASNSQLIKISEAWRISNKIL
ncbi:hypothetical protein JW756_07160 [Candidatus Woesearchaeota archaeon]|nr:hypothetical protein [Candidatus Woesearchaeota archaeon]